MDDFNIKVGERIEKLRKQKGLSREELAEMVGISSKFLYEIEKGKKGFTAIVVSNMSDALEVDSDYILKGTTYENYDITLLSVIKQFDKNQTTALVEVLSGIQQMLEKKEEKI